MTPAIRVNLWTLRVARNWIKIALTIIGLYTTLPLAAPILMNLGLAGPAKALYTVYSPFCHQFAFRSFFIGGDQPVYPRAAAETSWQPYESYIAGLPEFDPNRTLPFFGPVGDIYTFTPGLQGASREFIGNQQMGYKTALCQRDLSIYLAMFVGGSVYARYRDRIRSVPLWLYILLGIGPIGLDGFSQLLSYPPFSLWEVRETIPEYRVITGVIFGLMTAWLGFPYLDRAMQETIGKLQAKLMRARFNKI